MDLEWQHEGVTGMLGSRGVWKLGSWKVKRLKSYWLLVIGLLVANQFGWIWKGNMRG
jgi:hypothetical protein